MVFSMIKAMIYDLDDTLYDCSGTLVEAARNRAITSMIQAGLPLTEKQAYEKYLEIEKKYSKRANVFEKICDELNIKLILVKRIVPDQLKKTSSTEIIDKLNS